jgi:hypothetical protein
MRASSLVVCTMLALAACGSYGSGPPGPKTAAERAAAERAASTEDEVPDDGKAWGGWRYEGARDDCFYVVERKCFVTLDEACTFAECEAGCDTDGAGPATVTCK